MATTGQSSTDHSEERKRRSIYVYTNDPDKEADQAYAALTAYVYERNVVGEGQPFASVRDYLRCLDKKQIVFLLRQCSDYFGPDTMNDWGDPPRYLLYRVIRRITGTYSGDIRDLLELAVDGDVPEWAYRNNEYNEPDDEDEDDGSFGVPQVA